MDKFKTVFSIIAAIFVVTLAVVTCYRGGKDLKVGLYGVEQVLHKGSPYDNPTDPKRPIFRYAPPITILQRPYLLKSEMHAPFEFNHITPSVLAWYFTEILALVISALIIFKLIPAPSKEVGLRNLMIGFLLAAPLIAYELANSQNKIVALAFLLAGIYIFEKNRYFLAAILFNLGIVIYIPLIFFIFYFVLRGRVRYIFAFLAAALMVFIIIPSLMIGYGYNNFLLKEWFVRALKPFFMTTSYAAYLDIRVSSQSLSSAIGRIFTSGPASNYIYAISPELIHIIIRIFSAVIMAFSVLAIWKRQNPPAAALQYILLLTLPMMLPSYCLWYTWSWLFVIYFAIFNFISNPEALVSQKKVLLTVTAILVLGSYSSAITFFNKISILFWTTLVFWAATAAVLLQAQHKKI